jgi:hypothetical protein
MEHSARTHYKLGHLFIDAMTLAYSNDHLTKKLKAKKFTAPLAADDVLTRKEQISFALKDIKAMLRR